MIRAQKKARTELVNLQTTNRSTLAALSQERLAVLLTNGLSGKRVSASLFLFQTYTGRVLLLLGKHLQYAAWMQGVQRSAAAWPDRLGMWASTACVVHCLLTPVLLSMSAVVAHLLPSEERTHRSLAVLVAALGGIALVRGFRRHGKRTVLYQMAAGLACIGFAAFAGEAMPKPWMEIGITMVGSLLMIGAHRRNHTFCRECACAQESCC